MRSSARTAHPRVVRPEDLRKHNRVTRPSTPAARVMVVDQGGRPPLPGQAGIITVIVWHVYRQGGKG
jgi:hypothetical protein